MNKQIIRCENCVHNGVCYLQETSNNIVEQLNEFGCEDFADKSLYVKLPRKVGDTISGIYAHYEYRNKKGRCKIEELELKPCPFCGAELAKDSFGNWEHPYQYDEEEKCILSYIDPDNGAIIFANSEDNIKNWNRRV